MSKGQPETLITAGELEAKWREIDAAFRRQTAESLSRLKPASLGLLGLGLAALGGAYWLHRRGRGEDEESIATVELLPPREPGADADAPAPSASGPSRHELLRQAVVKGLIEGLTASGIFSGKPPAAEDEVATDA